MSKFNRGRVLPAGTSFVRNTTGRAERVRTHEGGLGYARDARSELYLLAVANMVGEHSFYENADQRDDRFAALVREVAVADPEWLTGMIGWLRDDAHLRSASLVAALEGAKARVDAGQHGHSRQMVAAALKRPDEPGEAIAYWVGRYGRTLPKPIKRGIADAVGRLYTERALIKYDTGSHAVRFSDVLRLVHAAPVAPWQNSLFEVAHQRRLGLPVPLDERVLPTLAAHAELTARAAQDPAVLLDADALAAAGLTWEAARSLAGSRVDSARLWEALIPSMGYMALLRNLRNFDEAGVSDEVAEQVAARLADPEQVARSRQLPMRYLSAHRAAPSLRWGHPLETALTASLANIPSLPGRTLVLVDTSSSMNERFSRDGSLMRWDAAALFGIALGQRCQGADVVSYSSNRYYLGDPPGAKCRAFPLQAGESLLRAVERWRTGGWFLGGGTDTALALEQEYRGHDRIVIVTDEQEGSGGDVDQAAPAQVPVYTWNLAGYRHGHAPSGGQFRHAFGGLTDAAFRMIPLIEAGRSANWPWA